MKKFITINGRKAWINNRKDLVAARESAINICDHSEEVIVRPIDELTDYTKEYVNNDGYLSVEDIKVKLFLRNIILRKAPSRISSGFVAVLFDGEDDVVYIYQECFYVKFKDFRLDDDILKIIKSIQFHHEHIKK